MAACALLWTPRQCETVVFLSRQLLTIFSSYTRGGGEYSSVLLLYVNLEQYFSHDTHAIFSIKSYGTKSGIAVFISQKKMFISTSYWFKAQLRDLWWQVLTVIYRKTDGLPAY